MSRERNRAPIIHTSTSEGSLSDDWESENGYEHSDSQADEAERWQNHRRRDDIVPSDSASGTAEFLVDHSRTARQPSRQHSVSRPRQPVRYAHPAAVPTPPAGSHGEYDFVPGMANSESDFYNGGGHQQHYAPPSGARYPYDTRYAPSTAYAPPSHHSPYGAQMVSWAGQSSNHFHPPPHNYFDRHEMMPYQPPGYPVPYSSPGAVVPPNYGHHMNLGLYPAPGPPPTDIAPRGPTPAPAPAPAPVEEKKPDPEFLKMKEQLELMQLERKKVEDAQARAELEQKIRQEEERKIKDRMDAIRDAQEAAKRDIELARVAAEAAAMERLEEARKAEDERRRMEAELRAQAAREERDRIEAERKAEAQRAAEQAAALERAERVAKEKYEAAKRAEEESKAEMARQKELIEIETKNKLLAEQKAAEEAKAAAELKAAEAAKQLEIERETLRQKAIQEHEEKLAAEKKAIADAEKAAAAAKQQAHDEFVLKQAEEKLKAEEAAAAAEQAKKDAEALKAKILEEGKKAAEEEAKKGTGDDKEPVKFKDAVGRKYSFPWRLASEWMTMESLIKQAFAHIEDIGPQVIEGCYDLEGPDGELILKEIWESTVQPGWQVTMKMWPLGRHPPRGQRGGGGGGGGGPHIRVPHNIPPEHREAWIRDFMRARDRERAAMAGGPRPVPHMMGGPGNGGGGGGGVGGPMGMGRMPPQVFGGGRVHPGVPDGIDVLPGGHGQKKERRKSKRTTWGLFGPAPAKKSSSKNRKKT
ncbi:unnamed protein product [Discula destructiva]